MSTVFSARQVETEGTEIRSAGADAPGVRLVEGSEVSAVEVRRRAALPALIGATASAVAIAYLWRASQTSSPWDWAIFAAMALLGGCYLASLLDARTPLLVADDLGVRVRLGDEWRGLPWEAVREVVVRPARWGLRDGRITVLPHTPQRATEGLQGKATRTARLNARLYGAPLAVPLGAMTRVGVDPGLGLGGHLAVLAGERAPVVDLGATDDGAPSVPEPRREATGLDDLLRRRDVAGDTGVAGDADEPAGTDETAADGPAGRPRGYWRPSRRRRASEPDVRAGAPAAALSLVDPRTRVVDHLEAPADTEEPAERIAPPVVDDFVPEPAYDPVIGPELASARTRLGLSVDELAERTRIRPHVIESIEVDDFLPCGGDFYARGHLRTLARVLGKDVGPLLRLFDQRYASAPVNARRVFEAELATGMTGSMRSTMGGPNWWLLTGAVVCLLLVWGGVRVFATSSPELLEPAPVVSESAGRADAGAAFAGGMLDLRLSVPEARLEPETSQVAVEVATEVVVRDGNGRTVFAGVLTTGQRVRLEATAPVRIVAEDGGVVAVKVDGRAAGLVGDAGEPGRRTFR